MQLSALVYFATKSKGESIHYLLGAKDLIEFSGRNLNGKFKGF